jgi:hypothetical protein
LSDHPPYSPDLSSNNYHPFAYLKNWLRSQRFNNDLTEGSSQIADFFDISTIYLNPGKYDNIPL